MTHYKNIYENHFDEIINKLKRFEIRSKDTIYKPGDVVILQEIKKENKKPTGNKIMIKIIQVFDISDIISNYQAFTFRVLPIF